MTSRLSTSFSSPVSMSWSSAAIGAESIPSESGGIGFAVAVPMASHVATAGTAHANRGRRSAGRCARYFKMISSGAAASKCLP
jgi:hypothetical protein